MPKPGRYVVAVSGGVDSMVLLDILSHDPGLELIVAHVDHGIRSDSSDDWALVEKVSNTLGVPCVCYQAELNKDTSEAKAREMRYKFLYKTLENTKSKAIITAHHQDDVIETAIINMLRGTGRKGLSSLSSHAGLIRPLLNVPKSEILKYAQQNNIQWREDSTNQDLKYLRNYVRHKLVPKLSDSERSYFIKNINNIKKINSELDELLLHQLVDSDEIKRPEFIQLPHKVAIEVLATWLRKYGLNNFDSKTLERLVVAAKTSANGKTIPVMSGYNMKVQKESLALSMPER